MLHYLEGDCAYSGCNERLELVQRVTAVPPVARVEVNPPDAAELGVCNACLQPHDIVWVFTADLDDIRSFELPSDAARRRRLTGVAQVSFGVASRGPGGPLPLATTPRS